MITWHDSRTDKPQDKQSVYISQALKFTGQIAGPMQYFAEQDAFLDIFATPEAGAIYHVAQFEENPLYWCDANEINLPQRPDQDDH